MNPHVDAAYSLHELFISYLLAGFTEAQGMQLVCAILTAGMANQTGMK